jgi:hypothetical protein
MRGNLTRAPLYLAGSNRHGSEGKWAVAGDIREIYEQVSPTTEGVLGGMTTEPDSRAILAVGCRMFDAMRC